jgi:hypothetical protein
MERFLVKAVKNNNKKGEFKMKEIWIVIALILLLISAIELREKINEIIVLEKGEYEMNQKIEVEIENKLAHLFLSNEYQDKMDNLKFNILLGDISKEDARKKRSEIDEWYKRELELFK